METPIGTTKAGRAFRHLIRIGSMMLMAAVPFWSSQGCESKTGGETGENGTGAGESKLFKMGGDIDLSAAPNGAKLTTMGGSIHLGSVGGPAELKTMGGDIEVESSSASLKATTMAGNVLVHVSPAGDSGPAKTIELRSNSGRIELFLPKDYGATVQATLAYTDNQSAAFAIVDDLGLQLTKSSQWDRSKGTPRKYIYATGRIGDGRNRIVIDTVNGNITVQRKSKAA